MRYASYLLSAIGVIVLCGTALSIGVGLRSAEYADRVQTILLDPILGAIGPANSIGRAVLNAQFIGEIESINLSEQILRLRATPSTVQLLPFSSQEVVRIEISLTGNITTEGIIFSVSEGAAASYQSEGEFRLTPDNLATGDIVIISARRMPITSNNEFRYEANHITRMKFNPQNL